MRVFFSTETGSLGENLELEGAPRVGDYVWHPLGEFKVLAVSWWMWGRDSVSLLVEPVREPAARSPRPSS